ncbi:toll/interleukin-1 receptor domain-containing protein [Bosea sp. NPDC003192]|uniref:toll/interleukin-1 receptor domain-containing protein n=1 Tax=Bosea sp. NPDC003192 TaxID=3390551 RepID=UPI003CFC7A66
MTETALTLSVGPASSGQAAAKPIFLCHNSLDKDTVKQIADMLDLEFGLPFFIDSYAIPTGEAFLPWIERSLAEASGVAIFLGANGWGPTHLWEAEKALVRYGTDPGFKLIPVALPGIAQADMKQLGSGRIFQDINWADFRKGPNDRDSLEKLKAALTGEKLPQYRGPARLTPHQIRRDAQRWANEKHDRSILYKGAQLDQADAIVRDNPDFVVASEVMPFLTAAHENHRRFWKRAAIGSAGVGAVLLGLAISSFVGYRLAEDRRVASLSRQLAIASREAPGADRQLLIASQAFLAAPTTEARGALLERIEAFRHLRRLLHLPSPLESVAVDAASGDILAGTNHGRLLTASPTGTAVLDLTSPTDADHAATAIIKVGDAVWLGRADGRIETMSKSGAKKLLLEPAKNTPDHRDAAIRTLAFQRDGRLIAAGSGSGRLTILDRDGAICLDHDEGSENRVTALDFDPRGRWLAAGVSNAVMFIDLRTCTEGPRYPRLEGDALALRFAEDGDLLIVSNRGQLLRLHQSGNDFERTGDMRDLAGLWVSAAIDARGRHLALGNASGAVFLYDNIGSPAGFNSVPMHGNAVTALAFSIDGDTLVSASRDGMVALWDLSGQSGLSRELPAALPDSSEMRIAADGGLTSATTMLGNAGAWQLKSEQWERRIDFEAATREALGPDSLKDAEDARPPAPGFTDVDSAIPAVAMDRSGHRIAWSTRRGALLWTTLDGSAGPARILDRGSGGDRGSIAMSPDGRWLASFAPDKGAVFLMDLSGSSAPTRIKLPGPGRSAVFDELGQRLAIGLEGGKVALFKGNTGWGAASRLVQIHDADVAGLLFAPDGEHLLSFGSGGGGGDRTVAITNLPDLATVRRLQSRQASGSVAALASGAGLLAAGDHDGRVLIWSLTDFRFLGALPAGSSVASALAVDTPGKRMVTYSADGSLLSWDLDVSQWLRMACEKANRTLRQEEWQELLPDEPYVPACR